ncbi:MAG: NAD-dependent epimerase/dehydratase family protein, partial [Acidimicrobiales bacterium]
MRVLATGAAGTIGRVLCPALAALGHEITGFDRAPAPEGFAGTWHTG